MTTARRGPFSPLLRHHRVRAGLSQEALAERARVSARAISALERGVNTRPQLETVRRLATALELDPNGRAALLAAARPDAAPPAPPPTGPPTATRYAPLPTPPAPLLGRDAELARLAALLGDPARRLLTLVGPGGIGKTRLAVELAATRRGDFADGTAFVDLAAIRDPDLVPPAIADALQLHEIGGQPLPDRLKDARRDRHLLLLLDNFEQVLDAAPLVADLLSACARLTVLATSRAPLRLRGEREFPVPPLALPDPAHLPAPDAVAAYPAVALFRERARAVRPDFALTAENTPTVVAICARLDGLPLALELAATRLKSLSPGALLARLDKRLPLLTGGARDLPARQRTLRDTIAWSEGLLAPEDRAFFRALAVFAGGGPLTAIEAICHPPAGATPLPGGVLLDRLGILVDQSLLRQIAPDRDEPRFAMLETIREYATERLAASGEMATYQDAHAAYFLVLTEAAEPELQGAG